MIYQKPKQLLLTLILLFVLNMAIPACAKDIKAGSPWAAQPILLDGQITEWPEGSANFLQEQNAVVRVANDSSRIYVALAFRNPQWAMMIHSNGLTIWFDGTGKKNKNFMVKLVDGPPLDRILELTDDKKESATEMPPEMAGQMPGREGKAEKGLFCAQKGFLFEKPIPLDGSQGPAAGFGFNNSFFVYEFSVPLCPSDVRYYGLGATSGQTVSIGLIWGGFDKAKMSHEGPPSGGMDGQGPPGGMGGGGGRSGGMRGGGSRGGPPGKMPGGDMPKKQEIWLKAKLSAGVFSNK
jgi:hypothetical protein